MAEHEDPKLEIESLAEDDLESTGAGSLDTRSGTCNTSGSETCNTSGGTCHTTPSATCNTSGGTCEQRATR